RTALPRPSVSCPTSWSSCASCGWRPNVVGHTLWADCAGSPSGTGITIGWLALGTLFRLPGAAARACGSRLPCDLQPQGGASLSRLMKESAFIHSSEKNFLHLETLRPQTSASAL